MSEPAPLASPLPSLVVGDRLRLELWVPEKNDELAVLVERSRPTLAGFLPWAMHPPSIDEQRQVQGEQERQWREGRMASWSIVEDGAIVGMVGLHQRGGPDELEIGYWLDDEATGRGIMTDACAMAIEVAFTIDRIDVVEIVHDQANHRSEGVPRRLGFARTGAHSATPQARCETGVKVRWTMRRDAWRALGRPAMVRATS